MSGSIPVNIVTAVDLDGYVALRLPPPTLRKGISLESLNEEGELESGNKWRSLEGTELRTDRNISFASQTVENLPQPNFAMTSYLL